MFSKYGVRHSSQRRESFGPYCYEIRRGKAVVALYFHDYRGDEHWLEIDGDHIECSRLLTGGGPLPLRITGEGSKLLDSLLGDNP